MNGKEWRAGDRSIYMEIDHLEVGFYGLLSDKTDLTEGGKKHLVTILCAISELMLWKDYTAQDFCSGRLTSRKTINGQE